MTVTPAHDRRDGTKNQASYQEGDQSKESTDA